MKLAVLASLLALLLAASYCEAAVTRRLSASRSEATGEDLEDSSALESEAADTRQHKPALGRILSRSDADAAAESSDPESEHLEDKVAPSGRTHRLSLAARQNSNHGTGHTMNDTRLDAEDATAASERGRASHVRNSSKPTSAKVHVSHRKHAKGLAVVKAGGASVYSKFKTTSDSLKDAGGSPEDAEENEIKDSKPASLMHAVRATKTKGKSRPKVVSIKDGPSDFQDRDTNDGMKQSVEKQDASRESKQKNERQNQTASVGDSEDFKKTVAGVSAENGGESQDGSGDDTIKQVEPAAPTLSLYAQRKKNVKGSRAKQMEEDSSDAAVGAANNVEPREDMAPEERDAPSPQMHRRQPAGAMHVGRRAKAARVDSSDASSGPATNAFPREDLASEQADAPGPQMHRRQPAVAMHARRRAEEVEDDSSDDDAGPASNAEHREDAVSEETGAPGPQMDRPQPAVAMHAGRRAKTAQVDFSDADAGLASNPDSREDLASEETDAPTPEMHRPQPAVAMHVGRRAEEVEDDSSDADAGPASDAEHREDAASEETGAPGPKMDRPQPAVAIREGRRAEEVEDDSSDADAGPASNAKPREDVALEETDASRPQMDRPQPAAAMSAGRKRNANRATSGGSYELRDPSVMTQDGDTGYSKVDDDYRQIDASPVYMGARTSRGKRANHLPAMPIRRAVTAIEARSGAAADTGDASTSAEDRADSGRATSSDEFRDGANADDPSALRRGEAQSFAVHTGSEDESDDTSRAENAATGGESFDPQEEPMTASGSRLDPSAGASSESMVEAPEAPGADEGRGDASSVEDASFPAQQYRQRPVQHRKSLMRMDSVVFRGQHRRHAAATERERLSEEAAEGENSGDELQEDSAGRSDDPSLIEQREASEEGAGNTESVRDVADVLDGKEEGDDSAGEEEDAMSQEPIAQDHDQTAEDDLRGDDAIDDQASATDQALMLSGASSDMVEGTDASDGEAADEETEEPTVRDDDVNMAEEGVYPREGDGDD